MSYIADIREEFRTSSGPTDSGGNPPLVTIYTWLERFNKQNPRSFEKAIAPVDVENWTSHMEKIFDVMGSRVEHETEALVGVVDALSRKSGMIAGIKASLRVEPNLISRIKETQKEDSEIWTIVENLDKQVEFRLDDDNVLWQDTRLVVPNDASLRETLLTEAHSSPFFVHPGSTKMYHDLKQHFWWSGMK
nr:putative reverse transcriptase domain-containing protein [Tanacetum cinerariifolium]